MTAPVPTQERPYRLAVVRALPGLGDFLCAVPALRALRASLPFAQIDLIGLPGNRPLVTRFGAYLDRLVEFPGFPGIPEVPLDPRRLVGFIAQVQQRPYDLVIQMHGDGSYMNEFSLGIGARLVFGFHPPHVTPSDPERFIPYPADEPEVMRNLRLVEHVGARSRGSYLEFPVTPLDAAELARLPESRSLMPGRYAVVHPGASCGDKRWEPKQFAQVADRLAAEGITPVLTGMIAEAQLVEDVRDAMVFDAVDLSGRTSLGALAALMASAALVVANDTGISHLADALAVPSVVVFSASDPVRWGPLDSARHRVIDVRSPLDQLRSLGGELLGDVIAEVEYLLAMGGSGVS